MSEIKKLIERLCPDGVEYKKLGEVCEFRAGWGFPVSEQGVKKEYYPFYKVGDMNNSTMFMDIANNYISEETAKRLKCKPAPKGTIIFPKIGAAMATNKKRILIKDSCYDNNVMGLIATGINDRFLYYFFSQYNLIDFANGTGAVPSLDTNRLKALEIPVPPIEVQSKIVEILDNFTELEAELEIKLEAELEARRKQYEYYRNQLLTFDKDKGARFDVKWMKLGDICDTLSGFPFDSSKFKDEGIQLMRGANIKRGYFDFSSELNKYWESSEGLEKYLLEPNDIIISMDGSLVGKSFCYLKKEHLPLLLVQRVARLRTKENFKYIYYNITNSFSDYVDKKKTAGAIPHISMKDINGFTIPLPPLEEQNRIVSILDRFEALTTDLQSGLPAEIEARRKQYEYYREKLLTFKRKTA